VKTLKYTVDTLCFIFPSDWIVAKFDDWAYYRKHFIRMGDRIKAMDLVALAPDKTLYLIESKDYRHHKRTSSEPLVEVLLGKALGTLGALLPASVHASKRQEREEARAFLEARNIRLVLHLEQPLRKSKLFPQSFDRVNLLDAMKKRLKPLDPHPWVCSGAIAPGASPLWSVEDA